MYIRVKKNPSGTSTILLLKSERKAGKKNAHSIILKNFGTSNDQQVLRRLKNEAESYKQQLLKQNPKVNILRISSSKDIDSCAVVHRGFHDIYGSIFDKLAKNFVLKGTTNIELLRDLSILRLANPASKHKTAKLAQNYGCNFTVDRIYKLMDKMNDEFIVSAKHSIKANSISLLKANREALDIVFYDLTTIYFETNTKDDLRQFGFSKDGKSQHVQITLALIVTKHGLPIGYELFPGNMYEGHTLELIINKLKDLYNINKIVVVADSGLLNKGNIEILNRFGYEYIIAARIKNMNTKLIAQITSKDDYIDINEDMSAKTINYLDNQTIIACYSKIKARKDEYELDDKLAKLILKHGKSSKQLLASKFKQSYIKLDKQTKIIIDEEEIEKVKQFHGLFALITNKKNPDATEIILQYKGLWQIEQSFRIIKSDISIRPIFHWSIARMKAHFCLCYIAFAMCRFLQYKLQKYSICYSPENIAEALHSLKTMRINSKGLIFNINQNTDKRLVAIYKAIRKAIPKTFSSL